MAAMIGSDVMEIAPVYHVEMPAPLRTPSGLMYTIVLISDMGKVCVAQSHGAQLPQLVQTPPVITYAFQWLCCGYA